MMTWFWLHRCFLIDSDGWCRKHVIWQWLTVEKRPQFRVFNKGALKLHPCYHLIFYDYSKMHTRRATCWDQCQQWTVQRNTWVNVTITETWRHPNYIASRQSELHGDRHGSIPSRVMEGEWWDHYRTHACHLPLQPFNVWPFNSIPILKPFSKVVCWGRLLYIKTWPGTQEKGNNDDFVASKKVKYTCTSRGGQSCVKPWINVLPSDAKTCEDLDGGKSGRIRPFKWEFSHYASRKSTTLNT